MFQQFYLCLILKQEKTARFILVSAEDIIVLVVAVVVVILRHVPLLCCAPLDIVVMESIFLLFYLIFVPCLHIYYVRCSVCHRARSEPLLL